MKDSKSRQRKQAKPYEKNVLYTPEFLKIQQEFLAVKPNQTRSEYNSNHQVTKYHITKSAVEWYDTVRSKLYHRMQANPYKQKDKIHLGSCTYSVFKLFELETKFKKSSTWRSEYRDGQTIALPQLRYLFEAPHLPIFANPKWTMKHYTRTVNQGTVHEETYYYRLRYVKLTLIYDYDFRTVDGDFLYVCENWDPITKEWKIA